MASCKIIFLKSQHVETYWPYKRNNKYTFFWLTRQIQYLLLLSSVFAFYLLTYLFFQFYCDIIDDITLDKFKVYSIKIWYKYILQNDHHNNFS